MPWLRKASQIYSSSWRASCSTLTRPFNANNMAKSNDGSGGTEDAPWHPSYLDWPVLAGFGIAFLVVAISCQVLLYYSNKNNGLATSYQGLHYLWTYGPTAILTLIASFWARVECQTKISAPWCRMLKGAATSKQSVMLDYISQFQPLAIHTAIKNKDYSVAASTLVSLLLRLAIVISTSLIVLSRVDVQIGNMEITLKARFLDDSDLSILDRLKTEQPFSTLNAIIAANISLPEGVSEIYAYVTAESNIPNVSELATTVDGFEASLDCKPATTVLSTTDKEKRVRLSSDSYETTITLEELFLVDISNDTYPYDTYPYDTYPYYPRYNDQGVLNTLRTLRSPRNGPYGVDDTVAIVAITFLGTPNLPIANSSHPDAFFTEVTILRANSFICRPYYKIKPFKTLTSNAGVQVSPVAGTTARQLTFASPWDIWWDLDQSFAWPLRRPSIWLSDELLYVDPHSLQALQLGNHTRSKYIPTLASVFDGDNISRLVSSFYQQYAAIFARVIMMEDTSTPSNGSIIVNEQRLLVQAASAHIMTGILLASITGIILTWWWQLILILPQSPTTIIGNAILLANVPLCLTGTGCASTSDLKIVMDNWVCRLKVGETATKNPQFLLCSDEKLFLLLSGCPHL
ncbi:hypothetical protein F4808DRAFT_452302 [Astrocystis sublimbata]|nr:hypothetical protein F4808DRAFT_452302 [Astrocystis sublimbata]